MLKFGLLNPRNPLWPRLGWSLTGISTLVTVGFFLQRPKSVRAGSGAVPFDGRGLSRFGRVIEKLDRSTFTLHYETARGGEHDLQLEGIRGEVAEAEVLWKLECPRATREAGSWLLHGPLTVEARDARSQQILGRGRMAKEGPALRWHQGVWSGLDHLSWESLEGQGQGRWDMPAGWNRGVDHRFNVDRGPVQWSAIRPGALKGMTASRMSVVLGLEDAWMEGVKSQLAGGEAEAAKVLLDRQAMRWEAPIVFRREDGWSGEALSGWAPRPEPGETLQCMEFKGFTARKPVPGGQQTLRASGVRWSPEGLRLEGDVTWTMPSPESDQKAEGPLELRTPRMLYRSAPGEADLPGALPVGDAWAEGLAVLTWGPRSLSSPRLEARRADQSWVVHAPSLGKSEQGTFSAGRGHGRPGHWEFEGPVTAQLFRGGSLRSGKLVWENQVWTFTGRPVTYTTGRERLSGPRVVRKGDQVLFPDGLSGAVLSKDGDLTFRADQGERRANTLEVRGRVGCVATQWRLDADRVLVSLGPDQAVERVEATGHVALTGAMGEGQGQRLVLDLARRKVWWEGRVRGTSEVRQ